MKILITGSSGFIGSALVPELRRRGHDVWEGLRYVSGRFDGYTTRQAVFFDLRDSDETRRAVQQVKPDAIVHLGAQSAVAYSFTHPQEVADVNFMGVVRIAEAAREAGAWLVFAATSECYGRADNHFPTTEETPLGGTSPYAAAKIAAVEYLRVQQSTYQMPITLAFPFNTIGRALVPPKGNKFFVVERAITQAIETGQINLHDSRPRRDFLHRTDHVAAYCAILGNRNGAVGEAFNICTGDSWTIGDMALKVAEYIAKKTGKRVEVEFSNTPDRPLDIPRLQGSNEKIRRVLGWQPLYTIGQAIEQAADEWLEVLSRR